MVSMTTRKYNMTTNNFRLESGQEYSLKQLFNGKYRIVIPDLQRDYCWGDKAWDKDAKNYTELVSGFLDSLITVFNEKPNEDLTLGLIYGYENPHFTIHLCDGQQRLTTLFLLVGMLNRRTENNHFKPVLISEDELADDHEPILLYAIRESTLYFMSDLVCEFFLKKDVKIEDIYKREWYFNDYGLDASIQSVISAIKTIDVKINHIDTLKFGEFVINSLLLIYYDMGHRTRGEETFVVINTTGEPLTATENLKPILIGNIKNEQERKTASDEWEEREEYFWQKKANNEQTSDNALKDFFIWYWQIRLLQEKSWRDKKSHPLNPHELFQKTPLITEDQEEIPDISKWEHSRNLGILHKYFIALKNLVRICKENNQISLVLRTIEDNEISLTWFREVSLDVLLPLVAYVEKFQTHENLYHFIRRIRKNFFDKKWEDRKKNYLDWRHIIRIIELSESEIEVLRYETLSRAEKFKKISNVPLNEWYNPEERLKDQFFSNRTEIEKWEDHKDFMGDISFLLSISQFQGVDFSFNDLQRYYWNYTEIIDLIRDQTFEPKTNIYRLYLLFIGCEKVEHKPRVSWEIEGVLFSTIARNHLFIDEFRKLLYNKEADLQSYCLNYVKNKINEWTLFGLDESNFTAERALKCWLTLKVFNANKENVCLAYWDGNNAEEGVSAYKSFAPNKLIESEPYSIYNMICGFGVKSGGGGSYIHYAYGENWLKPNIIDTPFAGVDFDVKKRTKDQLEENKKIIDSAVESIKN